MLLVNLANSSPKTNPLNNNMVKKEINIIFLGLNLSFDFSPYFEVFYVVIFPYQALE